MAIKKSANPSEGAEVESNNAEESTNLDEYIVGPESDKKPVLSVVMPTLNEEEGIRICIEKIKQAAAEMQLPTEIVVSDSSTDRTPEIARNTGAVVVEPDKPGYGYAYTYAFNQVRGEFVAMGDADTTYDFAELPRLMRSLRETDADIVMGSRLEGEIKDGAMPALHQYIGNPLLTRFLNTFYDAGVSDAHSGFRLMRRDALETMELETTGMEFASEMIMEAGAKNLHIEEVPIVYHDREGEETLNSFRDGWRHVRFMLINAPGYLFSAPGLVLGVFGVLMMALTYTRTEILGVEPGIHSMIAGSLLVIVGYQIASMGVFATAATDPIRKPSDPITHGILEHSTLEYGATIGLGLLTAGVLYAGWLIRDWAATGSFESITFTLSSMIAFTSIILGLQTIFFAFFLGLLKRT